MANSIPSGSGGGQSESLVERQARINAACSSFIAIGFRPELFTINNLHNYDYTESEFLKLIKPISSITDLGALTSIFNTARQALFHPGVAPPDEFCNFVSCINWMKSESSRILKKEMSKADVLIARMLVDASAPLRQESKCIQREIDELKKRQVELEREFARISVELKLKLGPIYGYEEPSVSELRVQCYLLYEENCRSRGMTVIPKLDEMGCANIVDVFGGTVKELHLIKFLNDPVRKELIETYLKGFAAMGGDGF